MIASALSSCANFWVPVAACLGSLPVSNFTSLIFLPPMPPLALISSTAISTAVTVVSPTVLSTPDITVLRPMTISCAAAGAAADKASAAAAAVSRCKLQDRLHHVRSPFCQVPVNCVRPR